MRTSGQLCGCLRCRIERCWCRCESHVEESSLRLQDEGHRASVKGGSSVGDKRLGERTEHVEDVSEQVYVHALYPEAASDRCTLILLRAMGGNVCSLPEMMVTGKFPGHRRVAPWRSEIVIVGRRKS